jgi:hypothetical protein
MVNASPATEYSAASFRGTGGPSATRAAVATLGVLVSFAGVEHGVGELLQGSGRPNSVAIESWPDVAAFAPLSGEPAMTVLPDLVAAGVLTIVVAVAFAIWAVGYAHRRHGGAVLGVISLLLLLVGGGFAPPLMGLVLGLVAARGRATNHRAVGAFRARLSRRWQLLLAVTLVAYLGLFPGIVLLKQYADVDSGPLVSMLVVIAFVGFVLTLTAALARDRLRPVPGWPA